MITVEDLKAAFPQLDGEITLRGLKASVEVYRDQYGIPHVRASSEPDAFLAQGFVTAQDRLWQMEYDRRRGAGRWAEVVGKSALQQDIMMRRFRLEASARADYEAISDHTRAMFDAYPKGVNAFIETTRALPIDYQITGLAPEPWQPWDSLVICKVRHILMGVFEGKTWSARLVGKLGLEKVAALFPGYQPGHLLILPPGAPCAGPLETGLEELSQGGVALNYLNGNDGGSNSWALSGSRTASGKPILAGDSHRALDTPNVYYQNHLACPEFDVVGLSFPGMPGFPHFGHNQWVAWCVTHTNADYQDLYIEQFKPDDSRQYLYQGQWQQAEIFPETIKVRGEDDVNLEVWSTHHGPVISGSPESGAAIAFRYTATDGPSAWPDTLEPMLCARDYRELVESMREWVDPVNNFLFADVHGNIGYLCRGEIPIRSSQNARLPVLGWTGEHEWQGCIPFEELPKSINPVAGYIATANNKPVGDDYLYYIGTDFAPGFRVERVTKALLSLASPTAADMTKAHDERVSIPAQAYVKRLEEVEPLDELSARARKRLLAWSGEMDAERVEPTIYCAWRDALLRAVLEHNLGGKLAEAAWHPVNRGQGVFLNRLKDLLVTLISEDDCRLLPPNTDWPTMLSRALSKGAATLRECLGDNLQEWQWRRIHQARPRHTLSSAFPELAELLEPPAIPMSGDGDTPLAGSYSPAEPATVTGLSVVRYAFDLSNWDNSLWAVPLGSSGHPGSPHYHDQSETWCQAQMVPMQYDWSYIAAHRETRQQLEPE